jgi:maltooligosyltrehalose trehalohydrolase
MIQPDSTSLLADSATNDPNRHLTFLESRLGATRSADGHCEFLVWAPTASRVEVRLLGNPERQIVLIPESHGYHQGAVEGVPPNALYFYRLDGNQERPDPVSRYQPQGVHGPSQVTEVSDFDWSDQDWPGLPLEDYIFYELHTGTFTHEGTFDAVIPHLADLTSLGVTGIEIMPVSQFPGSRNWGYDGAFPFAVQNTYGEPEGLKRLVNACHGLGLAVVLDVVYNHLGPEGNYLADFGPYFTDRYHTPWGKAINFDGPQSDHVVRYFIENAIYWLDDFHIDALRLDAVHGIVDRNAQPFLSLLRSVVDDFQRQSGRRVHLIAESDANDFRVVAPRETGGYGMHAQWSDDLHHALHSLQSGERDGYYADFGSPEKLAKALQQGFVLTGGYSQFRQRRHGSSPSTIHPSQLVVCSQNHDQVGNRPFGERSSALLTLEEQKLSAGTILLSPYLPLLFMGEEYGETAPFLYFTSHGDKKLAEAVRRGRKDEFAAFAWKGDVPDPQAESTFQRSKLNHSLRDQQPHNVLWHFYRELIRLRKTSPALRHLTKDACEVEICGSDGSLLLMRRWWDTEEAVAFFNFGNRAVNYSGPFPPGEWSTLLDSSESKWLGPGSAIPPVLADDEVVDLTLQPKTFCIFGGIRHS